MKIKLKMTVVQVFDTPPDMTDLAAIDAQIADDMKCWCGRFDGIPSRTFKALGVVGFDIERVSDEVVDPYAEAKAAYADGELQALMWHKGNIEKWVDWQDLLELIGPPLFASAPPEPGDPSGYRRKPTFRKGDER